MLIIEYIKQGTKKRLIMELIKDPRCYTDVCVDGLWYHYDHCGTKAYILRGGAAPQVELAREPQTEDELIALIKDISNEL